MMNLTDDEVLDRARVAYGRLADRERRTAGIHWPIVPDRRWLVECDREGRQVVTAYDDSRMTVMLARWRWSGTKLVRIT
jgi:hypothetical protein